MKQNVLKEIYVISILLLLVSVANATTFTKTEVDGGYFKAGVAFPAFQFALTDGGDTTIAGVEPSNGTSVVTTNPFSDSNVSFYDYNGDHIWNSSQDWIGQDTNGDGVFNTTIDTTIAGVEPSNGTSVVTTNPFSDSNVSFYDYNGDHIWNSSQDWIGIDADTNGVYQDVLNNVQISNAGNASNTEYTLTLFQASDCSGTSVDLTWNTDHWEYSSTLGWNQGTYTVCAIIQPDATSGNTIQLKIAAGGVIHAGSETLPSADATNGNVQTIDVDAPTVSNVAVSNDPINEANVGSQTVTIDFSEAMDQGVNPTVQITGVSGGPIDVSGSWLDSDTWQGNFTISDNNEEVTATVNISAAQDLAGNVMTQDTSHTFKVDTVAPTIDSVALDSDEYINAVEANSGVNIVVSTTGVEDDQTVNCYINDTNNTQISGLSGTISSNSATIATGNLSSLLDGTLIAFCTVSDAAGNPTAPATDTATKDTIAPVGTVQITNPLIYEGNLTQTVFVYYNEPMDNSLTPTITFNGNSGAATSKGDGHWINSTTWQETFDIADVNEETINVTVSSSNAQDLAGNPEGASTPATFNIDTVAPTFVSLSIIDPNDDGYINAVESQNGTVITVVTTGVEEGQTVTCYIEDENSNQITNLNGAVNSVNQVTIEVGDLSSLNDGTLTVYCDVSDAAGNAAPQASNTTIKDTIAPTFDIDAIAIDNIVTVNEAANLTINTSSLTDANSVNLTLNIRNSSNDVVYQETLTGITSNTATFNNDSNKINISNWNDGPYVVVITATDVAGNPHSENTSFYKFTKTMSELTGGLLDSSSTQLNAETDWTSVSDPVFSTSFGKVEFSGSIDFTEENTRNAFLQLSQYFNMNATMVSLNAAANALKNLNVSSTITLYDYEDYGITTPVILMNGEICDSSVCSNIDASQTNLGGDSSKKDITFTVAHWTTYEIEQSDSGDVSLKYAYVKDMDFDGTPEYIYVVFSQPVAISSSPAVSDVFELDTSVDSDASFGTSPSLVVDSNEENKVEITLGADASIDYRKLYGTDTGATAIRIKPGQTALVKKDTTIPIVADTYEDIATGLISVSNNTAFSVPYCVNMNKIQAEMGSVSGTFQKYVNGKWTESTSFEPLYGYKYLGSSSFDMPIYTYETNCDVVPDSIKIAVDNDWNLLGLDDVQKRYAADWLASLTLRSSVQTFIEQLLDSEGNVLADYAVHNNTFNCQQVDPFKAYWIWYNGDDGHMFNGFESDQTTGTC